MTEIWLLQQLQDKEQLIVSQDMMILWVCRSHSFVVVSCILIWYVLTLTKARPPWPSSQPELNELRAEALNNALLSATALHVFFSMTISALSHRSHLALIRSSFRFTILDILWGFKLSTLNLNTGEQPPSAVGTAVSEGALEWTGRAFIGYSFLSFLSLACFI